MSGRGDDNARVARGGLDARWHVTVIAALTLAACGGDDDSTVADDERATSTGVGTPPINTAAVNAVDTMPPTSATTNTATVSTPGPTSSATTTAAVLPGFDPPVGDECPTDATPTMAGYDVATGELAWIECVAEPLEYAVLDGDGDTVLAAELRRDPSQPSSGTVSFVAIDDDDGTVSWRLDGRAVSLPAQDALIDGRAVVVLETDGQFVVAGVDAADGAVTWAVPIQNGDQVVNTESVVVVKSNIPPDGLPSTPVLSPTAPLPGTYNFIRGLDRQTGSEIWSHDVTLQTSSRVSSDGMAAADATVVAMPGPIAVDHATGEEIWRVEHDAPSGVPWPGSNDVVLFGGQDHPLSGVDLATGAVRWTADGHPYFDNVWAVGSGAVYVTDQTDMIAIELANGTERWRRPITDSMYVAPWTATDDAVYGIRPNLVAWSPADGSTLWATNYPPNDPLQMSSVVVGDTNVVVTFSSQSMTD